ncbi:hypothetical protein CEXT_362991 [Caerostris extrusa]|uniref:Uncharacterized protein n=1 Tax=Caerostris extrusa TaxID=172846 RepID=A0AAV4NCW0_CAEEX|nr:hypothetical protein CEXT_362991 [Caerostris extrusa]
MHIIKKTPHESVSEFLFQIVFFCEGLQNQGPPFHYTVRTVFCEAEAFENVLHGILSCNLTLSGRRDLLGSSATLSKDGQRSLKAMLLVPPT